MYTIVLIGVDQLYQLFVQVASKRHKTQENISCLNIQIIPEYFLTKGGEKLEKVIIDKTK